ncbi:MAG: DUF4389 domain-containing protein [Paracoccaceae bacterium]
MEEELETTPERFERNSIWMRGLMMLVLLVLFSIAQTVLVACAVLQFGWMLFARERNRHIAGFGKALGNWMAMTARFEAGESEDKPFPWSAWR